AAAGGGNRWPTASGPPAVTGAAEPRTGRRSPLPARPRHPYRAPPGGRVAPHAGSSSITEIVRPAGCWYIFRCRMTAPLPVAGGGHVAPGTCPAVGAVVESPPAVRVAEGLEPLPGAITLGVAITSSGASRPASGRPTGSRPRLTCLPGPTCSAGREACATVCR